MITVAYPCQGVSLFFSKKMSETRPLIRQGASLKDGFGGMMDIYKRVQLWYRTKESAHWTPFAEYSYKFVMELFKLPPTPGKHKLIAGNLYCWLDVGCDANKGKPKERPAPPETDISDGVPEKALGWGNCQHAYPQCLTYSAVCDAMAYGKLNTLYKIYEEDTARNRAKHKNFEAGMRSECQHCAELKKEQHARGIYNRIYKQGAEELEQAYFDEQAQHRRVSHAMAGDSTPVRFPGAWGVLKLRPQVTGIPWVSNRPSLIPTPKPIHEQDTKKQSISSTKSFSGSY